MMDITDNRLPLVFAETRPPAKQFLLRPNESVRTRIAACAIHRKLDIGSAGAPAGNRLLWHAESQFSWVSQRALVQVAVSHSPARGTRVLSYAPRRRGPDTGLKKISLRECSALLLPLRFQVIYVFPWSIFLFDSRRVAVGPCRSDHHAEIIRNGYYSYTGLQPISLVSATVDRTDEGANAKRSEEWCGIGHSFLHKQCRR